jgi:hypothetical protein
MLNQSAKPHFFNIDSRAHSIQLAASPLCLTSPDGAVDPPGPSDQTHPICRISAKAGN